MILLGYTVGKVLVGVLCVSLAVLVLNIAYRKFLKYLGRGKAAPEDYCVLYNLEMSPIKGAVEFYFTTKSKREITLQLLDENFTMLQVLFQNIVNEGGQIVRFNSEELKDGIYYYQLVTENQKTMKKMIVANR